MFDIWAAPRTRLDFALTGIVAIILTIAIGIGLYGSFTGFLQTDAYFHANDWVALIGAAIGAGCALYLVLELTTPFNGRAATYACVLCAFFGAFVVTKGVPAAVTMKYGQQESVRFEITGFDWGGKGCPSTVVAKNPDYEEFRQCITSLRGQRPQIGRFIEVRGMTSGWGIVKQHVEVVF